MLYHGLNDEQIAKMTPTQVKNRKMYLAMWEEFKEFPDPCYEIAMEIGRSKYTVRDSLKNLFGLDVILPDPRTTDRDYMVGEVKFLRSTGQGLDYIAKKLGMTSIELAHRVYRWQIQKLVNFNFDEFLTDEERATRHSDRTRDRDRERSRRRATGVGSGKNPASRPRVYPTLR